MLSSCPVCVSLGSTAIWANSHRPPLGEAVAAPATLVSTPSPGLGGVLPAAKVTREIAAARGIEPGRDCRSPSAHTAFDDVDTMLDFVEAIVDRTGLPVGIKSAVGSDGFWVRAGDADGQHNPRRGLSSRSMDWGRRDRDPRRAPRLPITARRLRVRPLVAVSRRRTFWRSTN